MRSPNYRNNRGKSKFKKTNTPTRLFVLHKPYRVLCQFSPVENKQTLGNYFPIANMYPAGRLDYDSEGLLLLTNNGPLQHGISHPRHKLEKVYAVQVEGTPSAEDT